jgi:transcriptional regulator with XRE-family HTH domain
MDVGRKVRQFRRMQDLSQDDLAARVGASRVTLSRFETGARMPSIEMLEKLADALGVKVTDLLAEESTLPKVSAPPSFTVEEERRSELSRGGVPDRPEPLEDLLHSIPEALGGYINKRAEKHEREADDPQSPHFRTATTAALWLSEVNEEARQWSDWVIDRADALVPPTLGSWDPRTWQYIFQLLGALIVFDGAAMTAQERIAQMRDKPDELASKRLEKATAEAKESRRRVEELQRAAGG